MGVEPFIIILTDRRGGAALGTLCSHCYRWQVADTEEAKLFSEIAIDNQSQIKLPKPVGCDSAINPALKDVPLFMRLCLSMRPCGG